jgi:hypothetical protein
LEYSSGLDIPPELGAYEEPYDWRLVGEENDCDV